MKWMRTIGMKWMRTIGMKWMRTIGMKWMRTIGVSMVGLMLTMGVEAHTDTIRIEAHDSIPLYMTVYTPPNYSPDSVYPILYLLHGIHGNQYAWEKKAHISALADSLITDSMICPVLIVMPLCVVHDSTYSTHIPCYLRCMHDFLHYTRKESFEPYFPEIEAFVRKRYLPALYREEEKDSVEHEIDSLVYGKQDSMLWAMGDTAWTALYGDSVSRIAFYGDSVVSTMDTLVVWDSVTTDSMALAVDTVRRSRDCIVGISSGGRQAVVISSKMGKGHFAVVGLFSPVLVASQFPEESIGCVYWIRCGKGDIFRNRSSKANSYLERKQMPHDYSRTNGRHNWSVWRRYIADFLVYAYGEK